MSPVKRARLLAGFVRGRSLVTYLASAIVALSFLAFAGAAILAVENGRERAEETNELVRRLAAAELRQETSDELVDRRLRAAVFHNCREIEKLKDQIRASVKVDAAQFALALEQLGIAPESPQGVALFKQARAREAELIARFRHLDCGRLADRR